MKRLLMLLLGFAFAFAFMAAGAPATPSADAVNTPGNDTPKDWQIQLHPDSPVVAFHGTSQEAYDKVMQMDLAEGDGEELLANGTDTTAKIERRQNLSDRLECYMDSHSKPGTVSERTLDAIVDYFEHALPAPGTTTLKPKLPGHSCERWTCRDDVVIDWCNTGSETKELPSYHNIREGAGVILGGCIRRFRRDNQGVKISLVKGILKHADNWDTVVYHDKC
ncbi:hypothetical protein BJX61DRAFT_546372 [Aspergillus egyptiacus]|nr:hypothetical protein BJX61DRAFT_546372 [Aspergillus egyptiacus]